RLTVGKATSRRIMSRPARDGSGKGGDSRARVGPDAPPLWPRAPPGAKPRFDPARPTIATAAASGQELLLEDALLEVVLRVEQQGRGGVAVLLDLDMGDVAHLGEVGDGADRALGRLQDNELDARGVRQQGAAPAAR